MNRPKAAFWAILDTWFYMSRKPRAWIKRHRKFLVQEYRDNRKGER